jgi:protocatechuate 3,4-dioxygenase beta subunit
MSDQKTSHAVNDKGAHLIDAKPADAFADRAARSVDPRLAQGLAQVVMSFADLIRTYDIGREDLSAVIAFMTEVGETCSDQRQEWVLLADTLGLTSAVENACAQRPKGATPNTLTGPFYRMGAPRRPDGGSISLDGQGTPLLFGARVTGLDGQPVAGAMVEVWQANCDGYFENQQPDLQPDNNLRGTYVTGPNGVAMIKTVMPAGYSIPQDGPVADLLRRLGFGLMRPAHIQFRITAPGFQTLTTHVFDRTDPTLCNDPLFAVHPDLLADFIPGENHMMTCTFPFVLAPFGAMS